MEWSHWFDLLNFLLAGIAIVFTYKSWKRQDRKDKLDERRYEEQQRKSLRFNITFPKYHIGWTPEDARMTFILKAELINDGPNAVVLNNARLDFYDTARDKHPFYSHGSVDDSSWKNAKLNPQDNWFISFSPIVDENEDKVQNSLVEVVITDIIGKTYRSNFFRYARKDWIEKTCPNPSNFLVWI